MKQNIVILGWIITQVLCSTNSRGYTFTVTCLDEEGEYQQSCILVEGGPFANDTIMSNYTCSQINHRLQLYVGQGATLPHLYTVSCGTVCKGCGFSGSVFKSNITQSACANTVEGDSVIERLNLLFVMARQSERGTYDWCGQAGCPNQILREQSHESHEDTSQTSKDYYSTDIPYSIPSTQNAEHADYGPTLGNDQQSSSTPSPIDEQLPTLPWGWFAAVAMTIATAALASIIYLNLSFKQREIKTPPPLCSNPRGLLEIELMRE